MDAGHAEALARLRALCATQDADSTRLEQALRVVAGALGTPFAKILELEKSGELLVVSAGIGWRKGVAGYATVPAATSSSAGYVLRQQRAVIFDDIQRTRRFTDATLLRSHNVTSSLAVRIAGQDRVLGVLSVHEQAPRRFTSHEASFLEEAATILADLM